MFKMSFFIHTCLKFLPPFVDSIVHNALRQVMPYVNQAPSHIGHVSHWRQIHMSLHHAPYLTVNRTKIMTIRRPKVRRNEFWSFTLNELDDLTCTVCWRIVLPSTTINVSQGCVAAAAVCR